MKNNESKNWNTPKRFIISVSCFLLIIFVVMILSFFFVPKIHLEGKSVELVNINSEYYEKGVKATYQGKDITDEVEIKGSVDSKKEGIYKVTYTVEKGGIKGKITRIVIVKDIVEPIITLTGSDEVYLCKDTKYVELGYIAIDDVDGDITDKVKVDIRNDEVTYTVSDKGGNKVTVKRKLIYQDKEKPVITLTGGSTINITVDSDYEELGYNVTDNCDDDITNKVKVIGSVNPNKPGVYNITYEVTDSSGNKAKVIRKVHVMEKTRKGTIYLTFDDGPNNGTTNVILDILKEEGVPATFFVTNKGPDELIKREYDEGHTVALHTASHNYEKIYSSVDAYFNDLKIVQDRVKRITGTTTHIIRFPGGSSNTVSRTYSEGIMTILTQKVLNEGYYYHDWNIDSKDAGGAKSANAVYYNVINGLSKNRANVVLMHDIKPYTRDALIHIIRYGKNHGYTFAAINENTPMVHHNVNN